MYLFVQVKMNIVKQLSAHVSSKNFKGIFYTEGILSFHTCNLEVGLSSLFTQGHINSTSAVLTQYLKHLWA